MSLVLRGPVELDDRVLAQPVGGSSSVASTVTGLEHDQWPGHDAPVRTFSRTILEREGALSTLQVALDDALAGGGRFVLLFGEAGIGKTSVVRAFQGGVQALRPVPRVMDAPGAH